jgi:hypothetical protein
LEELVGRSAVRDLYRGGSGVREQQEQQLDVFECGRELDLGIGVGIGYERLRRGGRGAGTGRD